MRLPIAPLLAFGLSCDSPAPAAADADPKATAPAARAEKRADDEPAKAEPVPMPPAPPGTAIVGDLYVHTCSADAPCPSLLHAEGAKHCAGLDTGGLSWRLPSVDELESWKGNAALAGFDVFHFSGTAWDEDPGQVWIYDPASGSKTTTKPDRGPFTIRCVAAAK